MSDNVITPVVAGTTLAADDVGGVLYPRTKVSFGAEGSAVDVSAADRLPVDIGASVAVTGTFWQATQPVSGTFWQATQPVSAASLPLPAGAATSAAQSTAQTSLTAIAASTAATVPASVAATITPNDSTVLSGMRALYVGGTGDVVATIGGTDVTFKAVPVGTLLPIIATKIKATGTTATLMISLG